MDKKEKKYRKAKLSEYIDLGNGRYTDYEIEQLESIVNNRDDFDGLTKTYRSSYKAFDSEDTYNVNEEDVYTFHNDKKIYIERDFSAKWDDGQTDVLHEVYDTGRDILKFAFKLFGK